MKRKLIAAGLAFTMIMATACGSNNTEPTGETEETTEAENTASPEEGASTEDSEAISVMGVDWGYGPLENSEMEQHWEQVFDTTLDIQWVSYQDYAQKMNTLISTGSQPDVSQIYKVNNSYYYPVFTQAIEAGEFVDMTPYLFNKGSGIAETNAIMKNWDEHFWNQAKYNDGIYILPRSKAEQGQNSGIEVRKDLMKKYGFEEEPQTMDELKNWLIDLSKAATEGEGQKIYALDFFDNAGNGFMDDRTAAFAVAFTGQTDWEVNANGEFEYVQFDENYIDFLNWMKDLYDAGVIDSEFALGNSDTSKWKAGNSVAYLNTWYNWNQSADLTSTKIFDSGLPDTYEAWCLMPVQGPVALTVEPNPTDIDSAIAVSSACSEEKIQKIMEVFNGTEEAYPGYNDLMRFGVEGIHYKVLEDGTKDTSDEEMKGKAKEGYVGAWNQIFLKTDQDQVTDKFMREGAKRASDENIERVKAIKDVVYSDLAETGRANAICNLQSETYNNQWSVLTDDVNTMATQYVMGQINEDQWNEFISGIVNSPDYKAIQEEFKTAMK
ncbi:MAG: hypothetical protein ACK5LT_00505 [Lachnospirales bacterium]